MDLELQQERWEGFRALTPFTLDLEETAETIVPDRCPDIARVVEVSACLLTRSCAVTDGVLTASGTVKLTLLYVAEDAFGLRALDYTVPFEHSASLPEGCADACAEGSVCHAEARLLNPRKLFTRLNISWRVTPYCQTTLTTCGEIADREQYAIQTLCEAYDVSILRAVGTREFTFSDELTIPSGREPIGELLSSRVKLRVTEVKPLGGKLVLKGVACLSLLYAAEEGKLCSYAEELPFSQLFDGDWQTDGDGMASAALSLAESEIHSEEDGRAVTVKLFLRAFLTVGGTARVNCITDLYSTAYDLDAKLETVELRQAPEVTTVTQSVREQLDAGTEVKCVLTADVCFGSASVRQENGKATLRAAATLSVLYLDEADTPLSLQRRIEVEAEAGVGGSAQATVEAVCAGEITVNLNAGGIELRFPAEFTISSVETPSCACLTSLSAEPMTADADSPALVLRALQAGESLWDVAKQYRTTAEEILAANELTESSLLEAGQMLLIPRGR